MFDWIKRLFGMEDRDLDAQNDYFDYNVRQRYQDEKKLAPEKQTVRKYETTGYTTTGPGATTTGPRPVDDFGVALSTDGDLAIRLGGPLTVDTGGHLGVGIGPLSIPLTSDAPLAPAPNPAGSLGIGLGQQESYATSTEVPSVATASTNYDSFTSKESGQSSAPSVDAPTPNVSSGPSCDVTSSLESGCTSSPDFGSSSSYDSGSSGSSVDSGSSSFDSGSSW